MIRILAPATLVLFLVLSYSVLGQQNATNQPPEELLNRKIATHIQQAEQAQQQGDFVLADAHIIRLMAIAPKDPRVLAFRDANEKLKQRVGRGRPDASTEAEIFRQRSANQRRARTLVDSAKAYYESGRWDIAEKQLKEALQLDRDYQATYYYLKLIRERRLH